MSDGANALIGLIVILLVISVFSPVCSRSPDVNEELARTARIATESAKEANEDAAAFRSAVDRWYFVGMALAAGIPLVLAVILLVHSTKTPAEPTEVFHQMEQIRAEEHREVMMSYEKSAIEDKAGESRAELSEKDDSAISGNREFGRRTSGS